MHVEIFIIGADGRLADTYTSPAVPRVGETIILAANKGGAKVVRRVTWNVPVTDDEHPSVLLTVGSADPTPAPAAAAVPEPAEPGFRPPPPPRPAEKQDQESAPGRSTVHTDTMLPNGRYDWKEAHEHCPDPVNCDCVCPRCIERWENAGKPGTEKEPS